MTLSPVVSPLLAAGSFLASVLHNLVLDRIPCALNMIRRMIAGSNPATRPNLQAPKAEQIGARRGQWRRGSTL